MRRIPRIHHSLLQTALFSGITALFASSAGAAISVYIEETAGGLVIRSEGGTVDTTGLTIYSDTFIPGGGSRNTFNGAFVATFTQTNTTGKYIQSGVFQTGGSTMPVLFVSGAATIEKTTSAGWRNGVSGSISNGSGEFLNHEETVALADPRSNSLYDSLFIWLSEGSIVGANTIGAFEFVLDDATRLLDYFNLQVGSSLTYSWEIGPGTVESITYHVVVPEPGALALLGLGGLSLLARRRRITRGVGPDPHDGQRRHRPCRRSGALDRHLGRPWL